MQRICNSFFNSQSQEAQKPVLYSYVDSTIFTLVSVNNVYTPFLAEIADDQAVPQIPLGCCLIIKYAPYYLSKI
jgi:hypothetical protein